MGTCILRPSRKTRKYQILTVGTPEGRPLGMHMKTTDTTLPKPHLTPRNGTCTLPLLAKVQYGIGERFVNGKNNVANVDKIVSIRTLARNTFQAKHGPMLGRIETKRCDNAIRIDRRETSRRKHTTNYRFIKTSIFKILQRVCSVIVPFFRVACFIVIS